MHLEQCLHPMPVYTGPYAIRDAFKDFSQETGELQQGYAGQWTIQNSSFQIYPMGQWFEPCKWDDYKCHTQIQDAEDLPVNLVGHHVNAGAWLKDLRNHNRKLVAAWLLAATATCVAAYICCRSKIQSARSKMNLKCQECCP